MPALCAPRRPKTYCHWEETSAMAHVDLHEQESIPAHDGILPLEQGDRLTRDEFERRYQAMPHLKKAELIEGVVYVPSPVRHEGHGRQHSALNCWLAVY